MHPRATELIERLTLAPHPEGGYYREVYRSERSVATGDERGERSAVTTIYFLLTAGDVSRWHRVASDEVWHFYEGEGLELLVASPDFADLAQVALGRVGENAAAVHVVPAGHWQAARPAGDYALVGCTVGPGFDFADFAMLSDLPEERKLLEQRRPELALLL